MSSLSISVPISLLLRLLAENGNLREAIWDEELRTAITAKDPTLYSDLDKVLASVDRKGT